MKHLTELDIEAIKSKVVKGNISHLFKIAKCRLVEAYAITRSVPSLEWITLRDIHDYGLMEIQKRLDVVSEINSYNDEPFFATVTKRPKGLIHSLKKATVELVEFRSVYGTILKIDEKIKGKN